MSHEHHHHVSGKNIGISIFLNSIIFILELAGGIFTHSLALISDAMHNFSDVMALILSWIAVKVMHKAPTDKKTYGYLRIEILVAFFNSTTLVIIGAYIIYEAILRFNHPQEVMGLWMLMIASIGFIANSVSTLLMYKDAKKDINIKSAYLHLMTDAVESLAVVVVGALIYFTKLNILDPIISIIIGIVIIKSAWGIISETTNILIEGTPKDMDINEISEFIKTIPGVLDVHHLHLWSISSRYRVLTVHIVIEDILLSAGNQISQKIEKELENKFHINHSTLQLETKKCHNQELIVNH